RAPMPAALLPYTTLSRSYSIAAACGAFWSGVEDAAGVPDATMADGTPNGYARMEVGADGAYALYWHNARDPDDTTIGLHAPKVLRQGAYPARASTPTRTRGWTTPCSSPAWAQATGRPVRS